MPETGCKKEKMKHYIIVQFNDNVNFRECVQPIKELFRSASGIHGVSHVAVKESNTDLSNRYDIMIEMELTPCALLAFDNSEIHEQWKMKYGKLIANKIIFDCD